MEVFKFHLLHGWSTKSSKYETKPTAALLPSLRRRSHYVKNDVHVTFRRSHYVFVAQTWTWGLTWRRHDNGCHGDGDIHVKKKQNVRMKVSNGDRREENKSKWTADVKRKKAYWHLGRHSKRTREITLRANYDSYVGCAAGVQKGEAAWAI